MTDRQGSHTCPYCDAVSGHCWAKWGPRTRTTCIINSWLPIIPRIPRLRRLFPATGVWPPKRSFLVKCVLFLHHVHGSTTNNKEKDIEQFSILVAFGRFTTSEPGGLLAMYVCAHGKSFQGLCSWIQRLLVPFAAFLHWSSGKERKRNILCVCPKQHKLPTRSIA